MTHQHPTLPRNITVYRGAGTDSGIGLEVDGETFPLMFLAEEGCTVEVRHNRPPVLKLTLVAESINVVDQALMRAEPDPDSPAFVGEEPLEGVVIEGGDSDA